MPAFRAILVLVVCLPPAWVQPAPTNQAKGVDAYGDPLPPGAVARLGTVRFRQPGWVQALSCSPDGKRVATVSGGVVRLWDLDSGKEVRQLVGFEGGARCLAFSPDSKHVAAGCDDKLIHVWDAATAKEWKRLGGHQDSKDRAIGAVVQVLFTPDGKGLVSLGGDETIRLWDLIAGRETSQFGGHREHLWNIALAADGKTLAAYAKKRQQSKDPAEVRVWDVATGKTLRSWPLADVIMLPSFSPDLKWLATCSSSGGTNADMKLWEVSTGRVVRRLPVRTSSVAWSADGKTLLTVGGRRIRFWDVTTGNEMRSVADPTPYLISHVTLSPDERTLVFWGSYGAIRFADLATGRELHRFDGHDYGVAAVAFSPDGKTLATGDNEEIHLWDVASHRQTHRMYGKLNFVTGLAFFPDGKSLLSNSANYGLRLWDVASGRERPGKFAGSRLTRGLALSPDGKTIAVGGTRLGEGVAVYDTNSGKGLLRLPMEERLADSFAFSSDGKTLVAGGDYRKIPRWDIATGEELPPIGPTTRLVNNVSYSPDGRLLAGVDWFETIRLWETATGKLRAIVDPGGNVSWIAFSPDGRFLATANNSRYRRAAKDGKGTGNEDRDKVFLVDLATGKVVHRFAGHRGSAASLAFSPDGKLLASGGNDTTALLWDMAPVRRKVRGAPVALSDEQLNAYWADLAGDDGREAHVAVWFLAAAPAQSVPFLGERVRPIPPADPKALARLLDDFNSDSFADRQKATRELERLGATAWPALRKVLAGSPSLETRRRVELLLKRPDGTWSVRASRAVEALEHADTAEARRVLRRLADGVPEARITQEAAAALRRLEKLGMDER